MFIFLVRIGWKLGNLPFPDESMGDSYCEFVILPLELEDLDLVPLPFLRMTLCCAGNIGVAI